VQLANHTDTVTTWPIDRDDCFDPELVLVGKVDHAGIDGSGRAFFAIEVGDLRLKFELDERDEPIDEVGDYDECAAAGYFTLKNNGDVDRVLVEASSPGCESIMMHKSESVGGMEKMLMVDSVPVPAHQSVDFAPGGFHLMCMSPTESMKPGISVPVTLTFEGGISLTSDFPVRSAGGK